MKVGQEITTCAYNSTITQAIVNANQENTGYLAVMLVADNEQTSPVPQVALSIDTVNTDQIYGALATINPHTQRCGVITSGIVPIKKSANSAAGDLTKGIVPDSTAGQVDVAGTAGNGRGTVVGRVGNSSPILWVDLDVDNNATA